MHTPIIKLHIIPIISGILRECPSVLALNEKWRIKPFCRVCMETIGLPHVLTVVCQMIFKKIETFKISDFHFLNVS